MRVVPVQMLRVALLLLSLFFAHYLGRALARLHRQKQPYTKALTWILRTAVSLGAIVWTGGLDATSIIALVLSAASLAWGVYLVGHPPKVDDIHLTQ